MRLPAGTYHLGLSLNDGEVIPGDYTFDLRGHANVRGHVETYSGVRAAGWAIGIAGMLAGTVVGLLTKEECVDAGRFCTESYPYMIHGLVIMGVTGTVGILMTRKSDEAHLE